VRTRREEAVAALASGSRLPAPFDPGMTVDPPAEEAYVRLAVDTLVDPVGRLVHELLWRWGEQDLSCGCPPDLHRLHDDAVLAHLRAIEFDHSLEEEAVENAGTDFEPRSFGLLIDTKWMEASRRWTTVLRSDGLWSHVRYRARVLRVRRATAVVEGLRTELPRALVATATDLATISSDPQRLVTAARRWDVPAEVVDGERAAAAEVVQRRLEEYLAAMPQAAASAEFAARLNLVVKDVWRHALLVPSSPARASLQDRAAAVATDAAARYLDDWKTPRDRVEAWFEAAANLAASPAVREAVRERQQAALAGRRSVLARVLRWVR
jgi:hypothetical protein